MRKNKMHPPSTTRKPRIYYIFLLLLTVILFVYWFIPFDSFPKGALADISRLPQPSLFTYLNISSQVYYTETQGILYLPPRDQPSHFVSLKKNAVRGNHRHKDNDNSTLGEVIILLEGQYLIRIGDGETNKYEDFQYDVSKIGIVAIKFTADKCHAVKNIGKQTNWFASYYIKTNNSMTNAFVDKKACEKIVLT